MILGKLCVRSVEALQKLCRSSAEALQKLASGGPLPALASRSRGPGVSWRSLASTRYKDQGPKSTTKLEFPGQHKLGSPGTSSKLKSLASTAS